MSQKAKIVNNLNTLAKNQYQVLQIQFDYHKFYIIINGDT